jgi:hypothetical protein
MKNLSLGSGRGKFTLATWKPPLSSPLIYFPCFKYSNPREVPGKDVRNFFEFPVSRRWPTWRGSTPNQYLPIPMLPHNTISWSWGGRGLLATWQLRPSKANSTLCQSPSSPSSSPKSFYTSMSGILGWWGSGWNYVVGGLPRRLNSKIHLLTDKRRIHLRSASVRTYTFFTTGFPRFLSIHRARGLQVFDLPLLTNYSNPNYD